MFWACGLLAAAPPRDIVHKSSKPPADAGLAAGVDAVGPSAPKADPIRGAEGVSPTVADEKLGAAVGVRVDGVKEGARGARAGGEVDASMLKRFAEGCWGARGVCWGTIGGEVAGAGEASKGAAVVMVLMPAGGERGAAWKSAKSSSTNTEVK